MNEEEIRKAMEKERKSFEPEEIQGDDNFENGIGANPSEVVPEQAQTLESQSPKDLDNYKIKAAKALELVDDIVLKNYLTKLGTETMRLVPPIEELSLKNENFTLFKITKMVYEKDEYATDKFISVVNSMTYADCTIYLIVDGQGNRTDFYLGVKGNDVSRVTSTIEDTFEKALKGQFPGIVVKNLSEIESNNTLSSQEQLLSSINEATSISTYTGIPANRNTKGEYTNATFIQGIEKFATAMQGQRYTAIILATNIPAQEIKKIRNDYENIYTELSAMATQQVAYSTNESLAKAISRTKGNSYMYTQSDATGSATATTNSDTHTHIEGEAHTDSESKSKDNFWGKARAVPLVGRVLGFWAKNTSESHADTKNSSDSDAHMDSLTNTENSTHTVSNAFGEQNSDTEGITATIAESKNFTITCQNKHIQEVLKRIDKQLERIETSESTGLWSVGTYFLSYDTDKSIAETAASIFRSIMQGEQSGVEISAINSWYQDDQDLQHLIKYATTLSHPLFEYDTQHGRVELTSTSLLNSKEVAMMIGLPRKSVPGLPVVDHVSLAKEVVKLGIKQDGKKLRLGCVFDQGRMLDNNIVELDVKSLTQHTLVTGSTGCGKSNTIYHLIQQQEKIHFLIIEPVKGEYKNVFGNYDVYGTNPNEFKLLKINPFRFLSKFKVKNREGIIVEKKGVHVLEHIDRLAEIFNVCWPMYAAMPAVLKEAMLSIYEDCGWDLYHSTNKYSDDVFPNFTDLLNKLVEVIGDSAYSEEVKSNYIGSLVTRVKSLAIGINKQIFSDNDLGDEMLFDKDVIVDLSRLGSQETKALIMGLLVMRLNEYRANSGIKADSELRHITILEEAHNLLKRCSTEQNLESANVAGKSVEMISNSIAEMRTYGEGFIIVDQSPSAIDISAIRNTNTKIIMRLPEENDRKIAGKSAAMKDEQIDEIAKLPTGVAVVYQNNWEAPVLCQIKEFEGKREEYQFKEETENEEEENQHYLKEVRNEVLKLLLKGRINGMVEPDVDTIKKGLDMLELSTYLKIQVLDALNEYVKNQEIHLWKNDYFKELSRIVAGIVSLNTEVENLVSEARDFNALDEGLSSLIHESLSTLSTELEYELRHCLMCDYAQDDEQRINNYNAWFQNVNGKILKA